MYKTYIEELETLLRVYFNLCKKKRQLTVESLLAEKRAKELKR